MSIRACSVNADLAINISDYQAIANAFNITTGNNDYGSDTVTNGTTNTLGCWDYWQDWHYPYVVRENYPVYIQQRSQDKAKYAYEIIKILKDKKLAKIDKVSDFINLMDELIKIL